MMTDDYDAFVETTAKYPKSERFTYTVLGLNGEAGECADKLKKILRDNDGVITDAHGLEMAKELGDVLWYVSRCASEFGYSLDDIMAINMTKLQSRMERNVLGGSGDNR